ncbi:MULTISPECIES: hypothetical protein [unclassified Bartonella]|uniref:hypothetical protein n=1 Tax=unclassified Bartonella TaxID=2645622 RepID=UPI0035CF25CA
MIEDKSQHQSAHKGDKAFVSQPVLDQSATFKKWMALSTGDYIIICCLAILLLVLFSASAYMDPLEFFHIISKEQLQALGKMKQEDLQEMSQIFIQIPAIEFLRNLGWNGVWAFLCLLPQIIFGFLFGLFPLFSIFNAIFKRDAKEMMLQWENLPEQKQLNNQSLNKI